MINYNGKVFRTVSNTPNGETSSDTRFAYHQNGNLLTCNYAGGQIEVGHLIGIVKEDGSIDMRYHQINTDHQIMTGICTSTPEIMKNGKIRLHENWKWTSGDCSSGTSIIEEE